MDEQSTAQDTAPVEEQPQELQDQSTGDNAPETSQDETDAQDASQEPLQEPTPEAPVSAPLPAPEPEPAEPEWVPSPVQTPQATPPDINQFTTLDANGERIVDLVAFNTANQAYMQQFAQGIVSTATQAAKLQSDYDKEWSKATDRYPELKSNRQLRDMVQAIHANSANPGFKYLSPVKAAQQLFSLRGEAKAEGMTAAKVSRTVQSAANLGGSNPPAPAANTDRASQLKEKMRTGSTKIERQEASTAYISELIKAGKL